MAIYEFEGKVPKIGQDSYVHPEAVIIGDVTIGDKCYIGATAVLRGDYGGIVIGNGTDVQDGTVIHTEPETKALIGEDCLIGHCAMIHGPLVVGNRVLVGMKATVLDSCELGEGSAVAACSMVKRNTRVAPGKMVMGIPARETGEVSETAALYTGIGVKLYQDLALRSLNSMNRIG
ncbi:MAG: gamma carbonic anhydrase family protein [Chitinophagales bacterium]